jgi:hypothetical protein
MRFAAYSILLSDIKTSTMAHVKYSNFINFLWYQAIWFTAIFGGAGYEFPLATLLVTHLALIEAKKNECILILLCSTLGIAVDSIHACVGLFQYTNDPQLWLIPFWHMAIWLGFTATLRHSLSFMIVRPLLMTLIAGAAAPLSYSAAMRLGAVEFPFGISTTLLIISASWMMLIPLFLLINGLISNQRSQAAQTRLEPRGLGIGFKNH